MKIIIDANCAAKVHIDDSDGRLILSRLLSNKLTLCLCSELREELAKTPLFDIFTELALAGSTVEASEDRIEAIKKDIAKFCKSNDYHIVSLAYETGCRLLFSNDKPLHADFTNPSILPSPRGKVYQTAHHVKLLDC